ncbi:AI-2E family transporter [Halorussus marinus]|uniref:AI-2E family transporter n=1 Tax=Halorussus marinus TaxID=2505976 RepID=UPI001092E437|nr:AI-2E family transporter [Halorussus marinus]
MKPRTGFAVVLVGVLAVLAVLIVRPFLNYVLGAILLAFVLTPAQRRLAPRVGPRVAALGLVTLTVIVVFGVAGALLSLGLAEVGDVPTAVSDLPAYRSVEAAAERTLGIELSSRFDRALDSLTAGIADGVSGVASAGLHAFLGVLLALFLFYYLLKDSADLIHWTKRVTPLPRDVQSRLYDEAEDATWAVLKGHIFVAVVQGVVSGVGFLVAGIPNAAFWTIVMMVLAMVPIVGVSPVMGGATIYLLVEGRPVAAVLLVVYGMSAVAITDDYLRALVIDKETSLHSGVILLGVFGAAYFLGAIGLFVGPILLALFKATVEVFTDYYELSAV